MLTLRVLVDTSVVEAFAQGGRATTAGMAFRPGLETALVWRRGANGKSEGADVVAGIGTEPPVFSVRIWEMGSAWL